MITLWNPADEPQSLKFVLQFAGGDGQYTVPIYLNGRETRSFNISNIINSPTPDADGNVIAPGTHEGRAEIMGTNGENEHILVAMSEGVYNVQKATCQNPYCQTCQGAVNAWILASPFSVVKGTSTQLSMTVQYKSGTQYNHTGVAVWTTSNTSIATVNAGTVNGVSPGAVTMIANDSNVPDYSYFCYSSNPDSSCPTVTGASPQAPGETLAVPTVTVYTAGNLTYGNTPLISASVTDNGGQGPTGTATFSMTSPSNNNVPPPATVNLVATSASWSLGSTVIDVGAYDVKASYSGDSKYAAKAGPGNFAIGRAATNTKITNCPSTVKAGQSFSFNVTVDWAFSPPDTVPHPAGQVLLTATPNPGTAAQNSGNLNLGVPPTVTIPITLTAGKYVVTAAYQGDTNYQPYTSDTCAVTAQ